MLLISVYFSFVAIFTEEGLLWYYYRREV